MVTEAGVAPDKIYGNDWRENPGLESVYFIVMNECEFYSLIDVTKYCNILRVLDKKCGKLHIIFAITL